MSFAVRYTGSFMSLKGVRYRLDILQDGYVGAATVVTMSATPLTIEWKGKDKLEPVQASCATVTLLSKSDRQFIDLYTVEPGTIRLDVYRENVLYWSGTLDPELYSEPYSFQRNYFVEFTFSDFAILDRKHFEGTGFKTLRQLMNELISASGINNGGMIEHISTHIPFSGVNLLDGTCVQCQNFYDEDGEAMTLREVLDGTLLPFAMRMIQRNGKIHLYDLNAISKDAQTRIVWKGTDAMLDNDVTYNNVNLTFSPYEKTTLLESEVEYDTVGGERSVRVYSGTDTSSADEVGFDIDLSNQGKGLTKASDAKFYKVRPVYSGGKDTGVAWTVKTLASRNTLPYSDYLNRPSMDVGAMLFKVPFKPYVSDVGVDKHNFRLKVSVDMLFDVRYNPFEAAAKDNEEGNYDDLKNWGNFAYIPFKLTLRDDAGYALYHFENYLVKESESFAHPTSMFGWVSGEAPSFDRAWLCWYQGNRKNESGLGGWQTNKPIIGYFRKDLPKLYDKLGQGEFIPVPPSGGYLELEVGKGIVIYDYKQEVKPELYDTECKWLLYKNPKIEVVDNYGKNIDKKDIEYTAWIDKSAKEDLPIKTFLGTMPKASPAALGQFFSASDKSVLGMFEREGVTDKLEKLLIGTVYSAYSGRHLVLSGTTAILPDFGVYSEKNQGGKFVMLEDYQDLKNDTSQVKVVQFDKDDYEGVEFE